MANYTNEPKKYHKLTKVMYVDSYGDLDLIEIIKEINPNSILEIGCGTGYLTKKVNEVLRQNLIATDINQTFLDFAKKKIKNLKTLKFDARTDQLPKPINLIYCRFVFHHIANADKIKF